MIVQELSSLGGGLRSPSALVLVIFFFCHGSLRKICISLPPKYGSPLIPSALYNVYPDANSVQVIDD